MMKRTTKTYIIVLICLSIFSFSQTVTTKDTLSGTDLIIEMDKPISDALSTEEKKCITAKSSTPISTPKPDSKPRIENRERVERTVSTQDICKKHPKLSGYKILVGIKKNNKEANELKANFRKNFPHMRTLVDASLRPNYKILAGSFFTKESGKSDLNKVRKVFPSATLVQYQIYCVEAK